MFTSCQKEMLTKMLNKRCQSFMKISPDLIIRRKVPVLNGAEHSHHRFKTTALSHCFKSIRYTSNNDISFFASIDVLLACMLASEETKK